MFAHPAPTPLGPAKRPRPLQAGDCPWPAVTRSCTDGREAPPAQRWIHPRLEVSPAHWRRYSLSTRAPRDLPKSAWSLFNRARPLSQEIALGSLTHVGKSDSAFPAIQPWLSNILILFDSHGGNKKCLRSVLTMKATRLQCCP